MLNSTLTKNLAPPQTGYAMNSPLLFNLLDNWSEDRYYEILDISPANQNQLDCFSRVHCRMFLPGCSEQLMALNTEDFDTNEKINQVLVESIPWCNDGVAKLNLIMLWDLPNYLAPPLLHKLIAFLLPNSEADAILHVYIHTRAVMPEKPGDYYFRSDHKIDVSNSSDKTVACPMYYQDALQKILAPFLVQKGILLSNGLQEYLLIRR